MKVEEGPVKASDIAISITVEKNGIYEVNGVRHEPSVSVHMLTGATKLRRQLRESNELIVCPGVYDGLSARIAINLGFKAMYMVRHFVLQQGPTQWSNIAFRLELGQRRRDSEWRISDWLSCTICVLMLK